MELRLRGVTLEDVRSFLHDTRRLDLAVNTYVRKLSISMPEMKSGTLTLMDVHFLCLLSFGCVCVSIIKNMKCINVELAKARCV